MCLFGKMEIDLCPAFEPVFIGFSVVLHAALGQIDFPFLRNFTLRYYMKGRSKNSKGAHPKSRKFKGEKRRNESLRSARRPLFLNAFPKITLKRGNPRFFLIDFFDSSQKWQTKKTPNTRRCWGLTIIYLWLSFLSSCCALHHCTILTAAD